MQCTLPSVSSARRRIVCLLAGVSTGWLGTWCGVRYYQTLPLPPPPQRVDPQPMHYERQETNVPVPKTRRALQAIGSVVFVSVFLGVFVSVARLSLPMLRMDLLSLRAETSCCRLVRRGLYRSVIYPAWMVALGTSPFALYYSADAARKDVVKLYKHVQ